MDDQPFGCCQAPSAFAGMTNRNRNQRNKNAGRDIRGRRFVQCFVCKAYSAFGTIASVVMRSDTSSLTFGT
jgi:hypothetical protein